MSTKITKQGSLCSKDETIVKLEEVSIFRNYKIGSH